jgi:hypothetical protein
MEALDAARPMIDVVCNAPPADLAAEVMAAFGPGGPGQEGNTVREDTLFKWLFRGYAYMNDTRFSAVKLRSRTEKLAHWPIREAMQLLEHSELVCIAWWGESSAHAEWRATQLGLATLAGGKAAVRQRIKDRTGL